MVIWLLGISGAGKSTLAEGLKACFQKQGINPFVLDGDLVRGFFDNDLGYSREDREQNIKRILFASHVLEATGQTVIVANISPFEELRVLARSKLNNYHQIYLKKDIQKAKQDDVKKVYKCNKDTGHLVGLDLTFDTPQMNELVVEVDNEKVHESLANIWTYLKSKDATLKNAN